MKYGFKENVKIIKQRVIDALHVLGSISNVLDIKSHTFFKGLAQFVINTGVYNINVHDFCDYLDTEVESYQFPPQSIPHWKSFFEGIYNEYMNS